MTRPGDAAPQILLWDLDGTLVTWTSPAVIPCIAWRHLRFMAPRYGALRALWHIAGAYLAMLRSRDHRTLEQVYLQSAATRLRISTSEVDANERAFIEEGLGDLDTWIHPVPGAPAVFERALASDRFRHVAATNPTMPQAFNVRRLGWAGYQPEAFELVTGTEVCSRLKGSPVYYEELLARLEVEPDECLMIGNDVRKDLPAAALGIPVFLLINGHEKTRGGPAGLAPVATGGYGELAEFLGLKR